MKYRLLLILAIAISFVFTSRPAHAVGVNSVSWNLSCSGITGIFNVTDTDSGNVAASLEVSPSQGGNALVDWDSQLLPLGVSTVTKSFSPVPEGTMFEVTVEIDQPGGGSAGVDDLLVACHNGQYQGPGIPAGFVLQIITCNTPVFTNPGGTPVATGESITAGQTWFVNPVPVKDATGKSWTEVFVSSYNDPFILTSCLGGAPVH